MGDAFRSGVGIAGGYGLLKLFGFSVFLRLLTFLSHDLIRTSIYFMLACIVMYSLVRGNTAMRWNLGLDSLSIMLPCCLLRNTFGRGVATGDVCAMVFPYLQHSSTEWI